MQHARGRASPLLAESALPATVERTDTSPGHATLHFGGSLRVASAALLWDRTRALLETPFEEVTFDLTDVDSADSGTIALVVELHCRAQSGGRKASLIGAHGSAKEILDLYEVRPHAVCLLPAPRASGLFAQVGRNTREIWIGVRSLLAVVGSWLIATLRAIRHPARVQWADVPRLVERAGADGLPIVALINFLIGAIMAFQSAMQLRLYGADLFVADLVAISVVRELGPLMTAIIVASRSGASFAAELGTMRVSEEVDAIRTLGLDPFGFLVLPRLLALVLVVPMLTLVADAVAIAGGLFVALATLDLTPYAYLTETQSALTLGAVVGGLVKSGAFGLAIGLVACQRGLAARGGAEGVGRSTTSAVVTTLFVLVALDAVFVVFLNAIQV